MLNYTTDRVEQLSKVQDEALELFRRKNHDYGDAFADYDVVGVLVRLGDKVKRCQSISKTGIQLVDGEKMRDTLIDMHNYAAMAIMLMDESDCDEGAKMEKSEMNEEDELVLQDNLPEYKHMSYGVLLSKWQIVGDSDSIYDREQYYENNRVVNKCSCPSFKWSEEGICKHITDTKKYVPCEL
jgi:hypothetical protein